MYGSWDDGRRASSSLYIGVKSQLSKLRGGCWRWGAAQGSNINLRAKIDEIHIGTALEGNLNDSCRARELVSRAVVAEVGRDLLVTARVSARQKCAKSGIASPESSRNRMEARDMQIRFVHAAGEE